MGAGPDIALVSLGTTPGLRRADAAFADLARRAGVRCDVVVADPGRGSVLRRHPLATDLVEALWARGAARRSGPARVTVYSTVTAALLQRRPREYAVRFDAPAALNRPGVSGLWQRPREREVLTGARALLPWGRAAAAALPAAAAAVPAVVLHVPVPATRRPAPARDVDAVVYAGYPWKRGLDVALAAWAAAARPGERLVVTGVGRPAAEAWLRRRGQRIPGGVEWTGRIAHEDFLTLLGRARVFVNASRQEDHGLAQLEALAAGALLATVPSPGPYEALPLAQELAPELVSPHLDAALRTALDMDPGARADYARRSAELLAPYRDDAVLAVMKDQVLPALGLS